MTATIPESHRDILDTKALAHLATIMPDGRPQVTPVWFEFDGTHIIVNSAEGRRKDRNMRADARTHGTQRILVFWPKHALSNLQRPAVQRFRIFELIQHAVCRR